MGATESKSSTQDYRMRNVPVKLPMPDHRELDERFIRVLKSMNLPPDKATALKKYDDEKKWELICDQERVLAKNPPQVYIQALLGYLDPSLGKKRFKKRIENSTKTLKELEISLRTNQIEWVWEFLSEENRGLDVLVDYLAFAQYAVVYESFPEHGTLRSSTLGRKALSAGEINNMGSSPTHTLNSSTLSKSTLRRQTMPNRRTLKNSRTIAERDDVHVCITCLRAIMNYKHGFSLVMKHPQCINEIALSLNNKSLRTKSLVLELLAAVCLVRGGHEIILQAFDNFKIVCSEPRRFTHLMQYFKVETENIDFMVSCMQFINIVVHSVEDLNYRVHLQHEFTLLGLDDYIMAMKDTESEVFKRQLQAYMDNMFNIRNLLEDSEVKVTALERVEQLEDQLLNLNEKFQEQEYENMTKIVELEKQLSESTKAIQTIKGTNSGVYALPGVHIGEKSAPLPEYLNIPPPLYAGHLGLIRNNNDKNNYASLPRSPDPRPPIYDEFMFDQFPPPEDFIPVDITPKDSEFQFQTMSNQNSNFVTNNFMYVPYEKWNNNSKTLNKKNISISSLSSYNEDSDQSGGFSSDATNGWRYLPSLGERNVNWNYKNLGSTKFSMVDRDESGYLSSESLLPGYMSKNNTKIKNFIKNDSRYSSAHSSSNSETSSLSTSSSFPSSESAPSSLANHSRIRQHSTKSFLHPQHALQREAHSPKINHYRTSSNDQTSRNQSMKCFPVLPNISELGHNSFSEPDMRYQKHNQLTTVPIPTTNNFDEVHDVEKLKLLLRHHHLPSLNVNNEFGVQQLAENDLNNDGVNDDSSNLNPELLIPTHQVNGMDQVAAAEMKGLPGLSGLPKLPPIKGLPGSAPPDNEVAGMKIKTKDSIGDGLKSSSGAPSPPPPPPMLSGGVVPPPPPPPGVPGAPPPPPAPGIPNLPGNVGLNALPGGLKIKKKHQTKYRLPVLNWKAMRPEQVEGTVFNELDDEAVLNEVDLNAFEELFKTRAQDSEADRQRLQKIAEVQQKRGTSLIDNNRARNIAITLRKIGLSTDQICRAVYSYDLEALPLEYVEMLPRFIPNELELRAFKQYEKDGHPFDKLAAEDKFMWLFGRVERLQQRLNIMIFIGNFNDNILTLTPQLASVIAASMSIKSSLKLKKVFEIILAFGNYMNSGKRGAVYGFKLQSLDALLDTKSTDKKQSLLHYIVSVIEAYYGDVKNFYQEIRYLDKASKVSLENVQADVRTIKNGLDLAQREYETHEHVVLKTFLEENTEKVQKLMQDAETAQEAYKEVIEYFGETPRVMPPEIFFPMVQRFIKSYIKAQDDLDAWRKKESKQKTISKAKKEKGEKKRNTKQQEEHARDEEERMINELRSRNKKLERGAIESKDGAIEDNIQYLKSEPYRRADTHQRSFRKKHRVGKAKVSTML